MRRLLFGSMMLPVLLVALVEPAWAADKVEGTDFSLRVPPNFREVPQSSGGG